MKAFLSATYADLKDYRRAASEALERLGHEVAKMEAFGARPEDPTNACLRDIDQSDLMVGVYAHRYGFVPDGATISITEQEFDYARSHNKPVFAFFIAEDYPWPPKQIEGEPGQTKLTDFKRRVGAQLTRDVFTTPDDLAFKVAAAVGRYVAKERVDDLAARLKTSLGTAQLTSRNLTQGRTLSDVPEAARNKVVRLLEELRSTIDELPEPAQPKPLIDADALLAIAQGLMAEGQWLAAGHKCDEYARLKPDDWEANYVRGVAFANARVGSETNMASLRAYNDAIAFLPRNADRNVRARLFVYRGAMHKRLGQLEEAEADLMIAKRHARRPYEVNDIIYNLAGVYGLQGDRAKLLDAVRELSRTSKKQGLLAAIRSHLHDYFEAFREDKEFLEMIGSA